MSCQDQCRTNAVQKPGGNTKNKSQTGITEENVTWQITGITKMNALLGLSFWLSRISGNDNEQIPYFVQQLSYHLDDAVACCVESHGG